MSLRKNTYVTDLYNLNSNFAEYFMYSKETVLPLVFVNGVFMPCDKKTKAKKSKSFPNPATSKMLLQFYNIPRMRTKLSTTIIEYCNAQHKPILYLFPDGSTHSVVANAENKMTSKQRRDLCYAKKLRMQMLSR